MSGMWTRIAATLLWSASLLVLTATNVVADFDGGMIFRSAAALVMPTVGALIAWRRPGNAIGWLYGGLGLLWTLSILDQSGRISATPSTGERWIFWVESLMSVPALIGMFTFPFLLFPNGQFLSPRWRVVGWVAGFSMTQAFVTAAFLHETYAWSKIPNPTYIHALDRLREVLRYPIFAVNMLAFLVLAVGPVTSIALRLRRARGAERQQIKWFAWLAITWLVGTLMVGIVEEVASALTGTDKELAGTLAWVLLPLAVYVGLPLATGVAILRYRLYDIDVLIRRTLVYGALTLSLGLVFVLLVLLPALVLGADGSAPDVVIAGSTLTVAALTRPLRSRIQHVVDRRFFRRKYDAARTVEAFSTRLRDEVDLDTLRIDLQSLVSETLQPGHVSLWLRAPARHEFPSLRPPVSGAGSRHVVAGSELP